MRENNSENTSRCALRVDRQFYLSFAEDYSVLGSKVQLFLTEAVEGSIIN